MEGDALSATIEVLVQNLINVCKGEISLIRGLDKNAEKLRGTFARIQSFLDDAQTKSIAEDQAVKTWLKELEAEAFDADNVLDELNYQLLTDQRKKFDAKRNKLKKVASFFPSFNYYAHLRGVAHRIKEIDARFDSINKRAMDLGLQQKLAAAPAAAIDAAAAETDSFTVDPIFIGRDDDVSKIVEMLTTPTEEAVSILPIVGMGGLGKTTLARKVFNHEKTEAHFGQRIWVHVPPDFDAVILIKKVLTNLHLRVFEDESREDLVERLEVALGSKTCLLVLDNLWNEDRHKWDDFINLWSGITCSKGNGIIVTTRSQEVGSIVTTVDIPPLNFLSGEQCWSIIKDKAFKGGDIPTGLEAIGQSIAERCQGLPLAANVVGGVLRGKPQDEWRSIKVNWLSNVGGDENIISKILKLSFHHLSSPSLKKCFAYCSIFPKGALFEREQLIELWMAEGFLQPSQKCDMETIGDQFLKVLVHSSLLQVVERDEYNTVKHCSMHDLVHDLAASVLGSPTVNDSISDRARYMRWRRSGDEPSHIPEEQAKWLRAVFYEDKISDIIFPHFRNLHSLTLTVDSDDKSLPNSIWKLIHLRYLHISGFSLDCLPKQIGELYHLQTLRAGPRELPSTLTHLINLRHLHVPDYTELPPHLGRLTSLQTIPKFDVRDKEGHRIVELGSLKNLKGELKIYGLQHVEDENESKKANLLQKSGITRLALFWIADFGSSEDEKNVLNGLQPHPNLMVLEIVGFNGESFPLWTLKMAVCVEGRWEGLHNLMEITLSQCSFCDEIPSLGHLPRLKSLYLSSLENVKSLGSSFYGIDNFISNSGVYKGTISLFPALERLELWNMRSLTEWEEVEIQGTSQVKVFPCLEYLKIRDCEQLSSAPSQFTCLKELIIHGIASGIPLANICGIKLNTLAKLEIWDVRELVSLPDWLFHNNQSLSMLEIMDCPNLIELPDGLHSLNSLTLLNLRRCDNLTSIPYSSSGGLTSLHTLSICRCPKLLNFPMGMMESCAPLLEKLSLDVGDSNSWGRVSFKEAVGGVLRLGSQSLRRLELRGEDWDSLPDQLQHLTALTELDLYDFGIHELPEWFGNLASLSKLKLSHCEELKHLPSPEVMLRLTNLTHLLIYTSPLLEERCIEQQGDDVDSEWPKICHVPNIRIGGRQIRSGGRKPSVDYDYGDIVQCQSLDVYTYEYGNITARGDTDIYTHICCLFSYFPMLCRCFGCH